MVVENSTYVVFDIPQQDEFHKNFYTPRLEQHMFITTQNIQAPSWRYNLARLYIPLYEGWNFNSGNYLFTTDTK